MKKSKFNRIAIVGLFFIAIILCSQLTVSIGLATSMGYLKSWKLVGTSGASSLKLGTSTASKYIITPGGQGVPDNSNNLTFVAGGAYYITGANITTQGTVTGLWRWTLGLTFPDLSGLGHTAYPSIRTTGNAANVTGNIISQQAGQAANQPPLAGSQAWQMITGNESSLLKQTPTGLYREGGTTFPGGKAIQDAAIAFGYPVEFFLYPLAFGTSILAGVFVMKKTHRPEKGIRGSLLLQSFVSLFVMILWVFGGGGVISGWSLIPFGLWIGVLLIFRNPYNPVTS